LNDPLRGQGEVFSVKNSTLEHNFSIKKGHTETIRSGKINFQKEELVTVGEDSRMCVWGSKPAQLAEPRKPKVEQLKHSFSPYKK